MKVWRYAQHDPSPENDDIIPLISMQHAANLVRIINESTHYAAKSSVLETRRSRLVIARERIADLKRLADKYPRLSITQLGLVESQLDEVDAEINTDAGVHHQQLSGLYNGWEYIAVMRFATPSQQLELHRTRNFDKTCMPTIGASAHGRWSPKPKTFRQIGVDMDEPLTPWAPLLSTIRNGDDMNYRDFLLAIRRIVEGNQSVDKRRKLLSAEVQNPKWGKYSGFPGHSMNEICDYFFPTFLSTVPSLPPSTVEAMLDVALDTPNRIAAATDKELLAFKGIGPAVLRKLRARCAEITCSRDEPRLDMVSR